MNENFNERLLAQGITVCNDTIATGLNNNDLIVGPSGAGKTGGYVIPNLLQAEGSLIVADTKGNLCRKVGPTLRQRGYDIYVVNFVNPDQSCTYNPLDYIAMDEKGRVREQDVITIAKALVPDLTKNDPFWDTSARTVVCSLISYVKEVLPPEEQNLNSVSEVFKLMSSQYNEQHNSGNEACVPFLEEWAVVRPDSFAVKKYQMVKSSMPAEKTWAGIASTAAAALDIFDFREAIQLFGGKPSFHFGDLGHRKCAVFLNVSDTDRSLDRLINLFYTQALQMLCREADKSPDSCLGIPVRLYLDDFATNAYIPDFDKTISIIRSRNISVSVILQSLTQLETMYDHPTAMTIVNNCDHILYLGGNDLKTAEFISAYADKPVERVLCMGLDKAFVITRGKKATYTDKIKPYSFHLPVPESKDLSEWKTGVYKERE